MGGAPTGGAEAEAVLGASVMLSTRSLRLMLLIMDPHRLELPVVEAPPLLLSRLWVAPAAAAAPFARPLSTKQF